MHIAFGTLYDEYKKLGSKYSLLKKKPCMFTCWEKYIRKKKACIVVEDCDKMNQLEEENKALKKKVNRLKTRVTKFTQGSKILETILASQRCVFNIKWLGYQPKKNKIYFNNYFLKVKQSHDPNQTCNYCRSIGHLIYACPMKKGKVIYMTWVPKWITTNHKRPKKVWVPKNSSWFCVCRN